MTIDELIKYLEEAKDKHGNIKVCRWNNIGRHVVGISAPEIVNNLERYSKTCSDSNTTGEKIVVLF